MRLIIGASNDGPARSLDPGVLPHPDEEILGPRMHFAGGRAVLAHAQADAVRAALVDVQIEGNACAPEGGGEFQ